MKKHVLIASGILLILSIIDAYFTDFGIRHHYITEANPLMNYVYHSSIITFYAIKISLPILLFFALTKCKPKKSIIVLLCFALGLYSIVLFQHLLWFSYVY